MLENGSGEVLAAARVVALATWLVAASVPPSSAATVAAGAVVGAEHRRRQRRAGRHADQACAAHPTRCRCRGSCRRRTRRPASGPLAPSIKGCCSSCRPEGRSTQPMKPAMPVRKTTAYSRSPLAQPRPAAIAISCVVSRFMASLCSQAGLRLLRKACTPSRPSVAGADVGDAARRVGTQRGRDRHARRRPAPAACRRARPSGRWRPARRRSRRPWRRAHRRAHTSCTKPSALRLGRAEALGGHEVAPRRLLAQRADHIRADGGRQQAEPGLAQAEVHATSAATSTSHTAARPTPPA